MHTTPYTIAITPSRIYDAQSQDHQLQKLSHLIHLGEPPSNNPDLKPFKNAFSELSISDGGLILRGEKIVLPATLHEEDVHLGHPGQSHVKRRLRAHFWFLGMDKYIEQQLESCNQCQLHTQSAMKAPLTPAPVPSKPWDDVSLDLFGPLPDHSNILVSRCNLSRFPDAKIVKSSAAKHVLPALSDASTSVTQRLTKLIMVRHLIVLHLSNFLKDGVSM